MYDILNLPNALEIFSVCFSFAALLICLVAWKMQRKYRTSHSAVEGCQPVSYEVTLMTHDVLNSRVVRAARMISGLTIQEILDLNRSGQPIVLASEASAQKVSDICNFLKSTTEEDFEIRIVCNGGMEFDYDSWTNRFESEDAAS